MNSPFSTLLIIAFTATSALSQTVGPVAVGETAVSLDIGFGVRAVPASRITVPTGEKLRITAPRMSDNSTYTWTKNGRTIASGTTNILNLDSVTPSDAGTYACMFSTPTTNTLPSQSLVLGVGPTDRLYNLSTRGTVGAGPDQGMIAGFVVGGGPREKKIIIRAIGPSLTMFGVSSPLRAPLLRIFDANGKPYANGFVYPAVVGGLTYETDLADSLARAGAFSIPAGTRDVVMMMPFSAGNYTAQVSSGDGTGGQVLVEIYEVP